MLTREYDHNPAIFRGLTMSAEQVIQSIGVIIAAILGVGGVIYSIARGFFNINVSLRELTADAKEIKDEFKELVKRTETTMEANKNRLDSFDWLMKDFERRMTIIEQMQKQQMR